MYLAQVFDHPYYGPSAALRSLLEPGLGSRPVVAVLTWGTLALELTIAASMAGGPRIRRCGLALGIALVTGIAVNWAAIVSLLGSRTLLASVVIAVTALLLGGLVDASRVATRTATALVSGLRFGSLGLIIIGTQLAGNPAVLGPAIVFALVDLVIGMLSALEIGRRPVVPATDQVPPAA